MAKGTPYVLDDLHHVFLKIVVSALLMTTAL